MYRNARQQKILELIASKEIDTQDELCAELNKLNFNVTQATISRDIKELKLYKIAGSTKKYKYACLENEHESVHNKMQTLFRECVVSINYANNIIIIKTMRGNGGTTCVFIDSLQLKEIIGTIAGLDNVLVVVDSNENAPIIVEKLKEYI